MIPVRVLVCLWTHEGEGWGAAHTVSDSLLDASPVPEQWFAHAARLLDREMYEFCGTVYPNRQWHTYVVLDSEEEE